MKEFGKKLLDLIVDFDHERIENGRKVTILIRPQAVIVMVLCIVGVFAVNYLHDEK